VLVTEGYMDVVALAQLGFPNAVATLGTACTPEHVQKLFRFTDSVVFSFDGDAAGRRAARKALDGALPYATDVRTVKFLFLPAEHDPDSYIREHGRDAFARFVSRGHAAVALPDRGGARRLRPARPKAAPIWRPTPSRSGTAAGRRAQAPAAGRDRRAVQLDVSDLEAVVGPTGRPAPSPPNQPAAAAKRRARRAPARPASARQPRRSCGPPVLLGQSQAWDQLTNEDHAVLCAARPARPAVRLARQPGARARATALGTTARRTAGPRRRRARRTPDGRCASPVTPPSRRRTGELRDLLDRMIVERLKAEETCRHRGRRPRQVSHAARARRGLEGAKTPCCALEFTTNPV
jgi:DNA primase